MPMNKKYFIFLFFQGHQGHLCLVAHESVVAACWEEVNGLRVLLGCGDEGVRTGLEEVVAAVVRGPGAVCGGRACAPSSCSSTSHIRDEAHGTCWGMAGVDKKFELKKKEKMERERE